MRTVTQKFLLGKASTWRGQQIAQRYEQCRAFLYLHGHLSDSENERVRIRLRKQRLAADLVLGTMAEGGPRREARAIAARTLEAEKA